MSRQHSNLLTPLGYFSKGDHTIFQRYLRIPKPYLVYIVVNYRGSLREALLDINGVVKNTHLKVDHWLKRHISTMELKDQLKVQTFRAHGVPPMYCVDKGLPACGAQVLNAHSLLVSKIKNAANTGAVLYMHSNMGTMAVQAASDIIKAAITAKLKCKMVPFPEYMEKAGMFDKDTSIKEWAKLDLVCLYLVGTEYISGTGFTESQLEQFVQRRRMQGVSTILCSHLEPKDFEARYKVKLSSMGAVALKFDDPTAAATVASLIKELKLL